MDNPEYISIDAFASQHNVPVRAVQNAIKLHKIKPVDPLGLLISADCDYKFNLIGVYDYAARKKVTFKAVYYRTQPKCKLPILYCIEPGTKRVLIDWELYKDEVFRSFTFRHRNKD